MNGYLALLEVTDIDECLVPYLAAATAELALVANIAWPFSADDPPVSLLRMIAKITRRQPHAGGPHTTRLLDQLR
ncbi:hypothetical protein BH24ACT5_BH24ACT5_21890 [soil metagenome]